MELKTTLVSAIFAFGLSALASQVDLRGRESAPAIGAGPSQQPGGAATGPSYASLVGDLDDRITSLQQRASARADDWLIRQHLGVALLERARLTNQIDDFERVQAVLDDAFAIAVAGSGPLLLAARFNFAVHRLDAAEKYLDMIDRRAVPRVEDTLAARALRAEIAAQRGQYAVAGAELTAVAAVSPEAAQAELALHHARTGDPARAEALLTEALATTRTNDPRRRAWLELQLGVLAMNRGEQLLALERLHAADAELPGWWLVHEHIAEVHKRRGDHGRAVAIFEDLVRTTGLPQHVDALAALYQHLGEQQRADELISRAAASWEQQLARLPEAAIGHGLQHHLQFGAPQRALELALANFAARPGGEAQVTLASAFLRAGQPAEALAVVERTLATPYRTAQLHDVAARAYTALGDTASAQRQVELRLAVNPWYSSDEHTH